MIVASGADLIPGSSVDEVVLGVIAALVALTTLAACAHKTPLRQVLGGIGWVFGRLIGEPLAGWYKRAVEREVRPVIADVVGPIVAAKVDPLARDLRAHMDDEGTILNALRGEVREHVDEDRAAFGAITEWREGVTVKLGAIRDAQPD